MPASPNPLPVAERLPGLAVIGGGPAGLMAAEVARAGIPTVMMFVQSLNGISHNKIEDTKEEHLELAVRAFDRLASKAMGWIASR